MKFGATFSGANQPELKRTNCPKRSKDTNNLTNIVTCFKSATISLLLAALPAMAANVWDGGGTDSYWNTGANWDNNIAPAFPAALTFSGGTRLTNTNNLSGKTVNGFTFDAAAGAFTVRGNAITLGGNIGFNGNPAIVVTQTVSLPLTLSSVRNFSTQTNGVLVVNGGITAAGSYLYKINPGTMILGGANSFGNNNTLYCTEGTLQLDANQVISSVAGTNTLSLGANNADGLAAVVDLAGTTQSFVNLILGSTAPGHDGLSNSLMDSAGGGIFQVSGNVYCYPGGSGFSNDMATISATWDLNGVDRNIYAGHNPANSVDLLISGPIINSGATARGFLLYKPNGYSPGVVMLPSTNNVYDGQLSVRDNKLILGVNNPLTKKVK